MTILFTGALFAVGRTPGWALYNVGYCVQDTGAREALMRDKVETASHYLDQLGKDNAELMRRFAELATLRELVRQTEEDLRAKRASHKTSTPILPIRAGGPYRHPYPTAG
jgi:hypothetical protein